MADDAGYDFDIQTYYPEDAFSLDVDASNADEINPLLLRLAAEGAAGAVSGVGPNKKDEREVQAAKARERYAAYAQSLQLRTFNQTYQQTITRAKNLARAWTNLQNEVIQLHENGLLSDEQLELYTQRIEAGKLETQRVQAELTENKTRQEHIDEEMLSEIRILDSRSADLLEELSNLGQDIVTARLTLEGVYDGVPGRHVVFSEGDRYYIEHPVTGGKYYLDEHANLTERNTALAEIETQIFIGEKPGNDPELSEERLQRFRDGQTELRSRVDTLGLGPNMQRIGDLFSESLRNKAEYIALEQRLTQLEQDREQLQLELQNLTSEQAAEREAELTAEQKAIAQKYRELDDRTKTNNQELNTLFEQLHIAIEEAEQQRQNTVEVREDVARVQENYGTLEATATAFANRHEQLTQHFNGGDFSTWAAKNLPKWMINMAASKELRQAWNDPVEHEGRAVYRDNETLELYYWNTETNTLEEKITDPVIVAELNAQAYGDPPKLFVNETLSHPEFVGTLKALLDAEDISAEAARVQAEQEALSQTADDKVESLQSTISDVKATVVDQPQGLDVVLGGLEETVSTSPRSAAPMEIDLNLGESFDATKPPPALEDDTGRENTVQTPAVGGIDHTSTGGQGGS